MWRVVTGIAGRSDSADRVAALENRSLGQTLRIVIEMRVVVRKTLARIELIYRKSACEAAKELDDASVPGSDDLCASRRWNVRRFVRSGSPTLVRGVHQLCFVN